MLISGFQYVQGQSYVILIMYLYLLLGHESDSKQYCPPSLLARMDYSYTGSDTSTACQSSVDDWDVCTDRMIMTFDYTTCSQQMASSGKIINKPLQNACSHREH